MFATRDERLAKAYQLRARNVAYREPRPEVAELAARNWYVIMPSDVTTIGFTKTNAEGFFDRLVAAGVKVLYDVRLHNTSQLSGFAKADDLAFFLSKIGGIEYRYEPVAYPTDRC